jgi:hypothetical protein
MEISLSPESLVKKMFVLLGTKVDFGFLKINKMSLNVIFVAVVILVTLC